NHKVEIRKEGYQTETKAVTIAEGQTATLNGSLKATASGWSWTPPTTCCRPPTMCAWPMAATSAT
ncbi:MAG: PEGA domain-containing protein, partial [Aquincola sp.]|nr:PEGA domain-containing protein [Aquincola sp.]